ncbi:Macrolide export ATP-binding/permease protein MacB [compost metagenome]
MVPRDVRLQAWMALAFLGICLFNTVGLLLAKFLRRTGEIGVLRALGATRTMVFQQCLVEAALVGLLGGLGGLLLTLFGLWAVRQQPLAYADMMQLDMKMLAFTFATSVLTTVAAGMLPALRASRIDPALQIKAL